VVQVQEGMEVKHRWGEPTVGSMMAFSALFLLILSKKSSKNSQFFFMSNVIRCYKVRKTRLKLHFPDDMA
jgi:hypothetical protein